MASDDAVLEIFRRAAADREHGAGEIEPALIRGLLEQRARWRRESLVRGCELLTAGQAMMANLRSLSRRIRAADPTELRGMLEERLAVLGALPSRLAEAAWPLIADCHGVLTLSRSSAVAAVVEGARERGWRGTVVVLDGSEAGGGPAQARRLAATGPTLSQPDATALSWLRAEGWVVLVGADAVGEARFVNCVGSEALLTLAAGLRRTRLLAADSGKDLPEAELAELLDGAPLHRDRSGREWPLFEAVPMQLVTARISEEGLT